MALQVGTSGWSYGHWDDVLHAAGTRPAAQFGGVYTSRFTTVELNASFYRWPSDRSFAGWRGRLPVRVPGVGQGASWSDPRQATSGAEA